MEGGNDVGPIGDGLDMQLLLVESNKRLPGHACYSGRQSQMYLLLAQDAEAAFQDMQGALRDAQDE